MRFDVLSRHRILARLLIAPAMIAGLALATTAVASADPGVGVIGPRPSSNADGVRCIQQALGVPVDGKYGDQTYGGQVAHGRWLEKNAERGIDACADAAKAGLDQRVSAGIGA